MFFQTEAAAIKQVADSIYVESQSAIKALQSTSVRARKNVHKKAGRYLIGQQSEPLLSTSPHGYTS